MPGQEKTEAATPRRREEARKKGQVAKSVEVNTVIMVLAGFILFRVYGQQTYDQLFVFTQNIFRDLSVVDVNQADFASRSWAIVLFVLQLLLPILMGLLVIGIIANLLQVGFMFSLEAMTPKFSRINPLEGFKRLFSGRALFDLVKATAKVGLASYLAYDLLLQKQETLMLLSSTNLQTAFSVLLEIGYDVGIKIGSALLVIAVLDYAYQRWQFEKSLRMSREDIKEEIKSTEGNMQIKARIRQQQRLMAQRRMMQAVPKADVVITNPTHLAIALQYDSLTMRAPTVVAKGERIMAERIKKVARENGVPVVEDKPLARAIYQSAEIGMEVPATMFQAVAELLAYIYSLKKRKGWLGSSSPMTASNLSNLPNRE